MSEQQYTDSEPKFNCTNDRCGWWGAKSECKRKPGLLYCPQCGMPVTTKQQHTDSPVTGSGGVAGEWIEVETDCRKYRVRRVSKCFTIELRLFTGEWVTVHEDSERHLLQVIHTERQHHRQREAAATALYRAAKLATLHGTDAARIHESPEVSALREAVKAYEAILSPDDATGEATTDVGIMLDKLLELFYIREYDGGLCYRFDACMAVHEVMDEMEIAEELSDRRIAIARRCDGGDHDS